MKEPIQEKVEYCLNCKVKPCSNKGCPLGNDIPGFIQAVKQGNIKEAYSIQCETSVLPGVCGRICPHQKQCQGSCVRGIKGETVKIGDIEAYVFDKAMEMGLSLRAMYDLPSKVQAQPKKVAVVGGGPAGLTCAAFLAREGVQVTIYEKHSYLGGLLMHGIPDFRLPKELVQKTIEMILALGVQVQYGKTIGKEIQLETLKQDYDAIFLAIGANQSSKMGVEGEELEGVYGGNELLEKNEHPDYSGKVVAVVGGGNVAMDCARTIKRKGAKEVKVIYRRAREQMPAERKEIEEAEKEGIEFLFQNNIVKILGESHVNKVELIRTELVKKEGEKREVPVNIENSNYQIAVDDIVMALGGMVEDEALYLPLNHNQWGNIIVNEAYQTSDPKVFAGGDLAGIKGTVAWAAKSGREAAKSIVKFMESKTAKC